MVASPVRRRAIRSVMARWIMASERAGRVSRCGPLEDRVHDLAQFMLGRTSEVQGPAATLEAPGPQDRLDQLPAGIGQITRIRTSLGHDLGIPSRVECAQACVFSRGSAVWTRASRDETGSSRIPHQASHRPTLGPPPHRQPHRHRIPTTRKTADTRANKMKTTSQCLFLNSLLK